MSQYEVFWLIKNHLSFFIKSFLYCSFIVYSARLAVQLGFLVWNLPLTWLGALDAHVNPDGRLGQLMSTTVLGCDPVVSNRWKKSLYDYISRKSNRSCLVWACDVLSISTPRDCFPWQSFLPDSISIFLPWMYFQTDFSLWANVHYFFLTGLPESTTVCTADTDGTVSNTMRLG